MAAVVLPRDTPTPPPSIGLRGVQTAATTNSTPAISIPVAGMEGVSPVQILNKHMPSPNPGSVRFTSPVTPPASPPDRGSVTEFKNLMDSILYPPDDYLCISNSPPVYAIDASGVAAAVSFTARQPLPDIEQLFPWAHGLHPENSMQLSFFYARKKAVRRTPTCYRGICIVKVGRDMTKSRLKGSVIPEEILPINSQSPGFLAVDPREGFNVRNFHIQVGKFAGLSDIVVYGDDSTDPGEVMRVAKKVSAAQMHYKAMFKSNSSRQMPIYSTFIVQNAFSVFEELFPELVVIDAKGNLTGNVVDFGHWERMEMCSMSKASEISHNVWLGSTTDTRNYHKTDDPSQPWGVMIEASDLAHMPLPETLQEMLDTVDQFQIPQLMEFPGSGTISPTNWSRMDVDGIINTCHWIYAVANGTYTDDKCRDIADNGYITVGRRQPRKVLIHCTDGYTETSLLALAYTMYAELLPVHEAWIKLHTDKKRNFFAYDKDLAFLRYTEHTLLDSAARNRNTILNYPSMEPPEWLYRMDGSLPSRILSYMYLGNLLHANNCGLLTALGIRRVLSIGEEVSWSKEEKDSFGQKKIMLIKDLQDNGCDSLEYQFRHCLEFIDEAHHTDEPVLVHCRVGVSRSATICIAEVMRTMKLSLPRAYCYVRARRLNVIIQPHLRFMYELLKFEETLSIKNCHAHRRELEWTHIAREIANMNRPYTRQR